MRKYSFGGACLSTLALLSLGIVAFAQDAKPAQEQPQGRRAGQPRRISLVENQLPLLDVDMMKSYLKLSDEQVTKIKPIHDKALTAMREMLARDGDKPPTREELGPRVRKFQQTVQEGHKEIEGILTEDQKKKVPEMEKDMTLFNSVGLPPATMADLKINEEQKKKLKALSEETQTKRSGLTPEERRDRAKVNALTQEARQKAMEILTAEQKGIVEKWRKENPPRAQGGERPAPPR